MRHISHSLMKISFELRSKRSSNFTNHPAKRYSVTRPDAGNENTTTSRETLLQNIFHVFFSSFLLPLLDSSEQVSSNFHYPGIIRFLLLLLSRKDYWKWLLDEERKRERERGKKGNHIPVEGRKRCSANLKHLGESLRFPCEPSSTFSAFLYPNTVRSKRTALRPPYFGNLPDRERKRGGEKERDTRVTKKKFNCSRLGITVLSQAVIRLRVLSLPPPPASIIRPRSV